MDKDFQSETISTWGKKDQVEQALIAGIHGVPELKHDEKAQYLGEFKERIIRGLSKEQVKEVAIYPEIIQALKDKRATKMIIDSNCDEFSDKYEQLARQFNKPYTMRSDSKFKGSTGLVVISDEAVDIPDVSVEDRSVRLKRMGLSAELIESAGKKICKQCFQEILRVDPNEEMNYRVLTWVDRLGGERCMAHREDG